MEEAGYKYPLLIVGTWLGLAAHWWWRIGGKSKREERSFIPMPTNLRLRNGGVLCDAFIGPCACGATHTFEERNKLKDPKDSSAIT